MQACYGSLQVDSRGMGVLVCANMVLCRHQKVLSLWCVCTNFDLQCFQISHAVSLPVTRCLGTERCVLWAA